MPQKRITTAKDKKRGMTIHELREAIAGASSDAVPVVSVSMKGTIRVVTVQTQP